MTPLSPRQAEALKFISAHIELHGIAPSYDEISARAGRKSKNFAHLLILELERKGYLRRIPRRARAIEVVRAEDHHAADCVCPACSDRRYFNLLQLVDAEKNDPPAHLKFSKVSNIKRCAANRVALAPKKSTGSKAAALSARAIPSGGGL